MKTLLMVIFVGVGFSAHAAENCNYSDKLCPSDYRCEIRSWGRDPSSYCVFNPSTDLTGMTYKISAYSEKSTEVGCPSMPNFEKAQAIAQRIADEACNKFHLLNYAEVISPFSYRSICEESLLTDVDGNPFSIEITEATATFRCVRMSW